MRRFLTTIFAGERDIERSSLRIARRLRVQGAISDRETRLYALMILLGVMLIALAPILLISGILLLGTRR